MVLFSEYTPHSIATLAQHYEMNNRVKRCFEELMLAVYFADCLYFSQAIDQMDI